MRLPVLLFSLLSIGVCRGELRERVLARGTFAGGAVEGRMLLAWGDGLTLRRLPDGPPQSLPKPHGEVRAACLADVNGDGQLDVVLNESGGDSPLVWLEAPRWKRHPIDHGVDTPDLLAVTLFGRRGVVVIQKRIQVRFYEMPAGASGPWPRTDLYSIYTPSWQAGLVLADGNGDGLPDLFAGNYFVQSPVRFDLPWHVHAVNTWTESERSGMMRLVYADLFGTGSRVLVAAQRALPAGRLAWFEKPADLRQLWPAHVLDSSLDEPAALAVADVDGDGRPEILVGESGGRGRLVEFRNRGGGDFRARTLRQGSPVRLIAPLDSPESARRGILLVTGDSIAWWVTGS